MYAMKRAHAALVGVLGVGCLAETSIPIGRYEGDSAEMVATGTVDEPPPSEDPSVASDDEGGQEGLGTKMARDGSTCETAAMCSVAAACQTASCAQDRQCVVALDDDACPEGQACLLAGCRVPTPPCEERYGDAVVFCDDFELGIAWAWSSADGVLLEHAAERDSVVARVRVTPDEPRAQLQLQLPTPLTGGMVAVRSHVFVPLEHEVDDAATLFRLSALPGDDPPTLGFELRPNAGIAATNRLGEETFSFAPVLVPGRWNCLEWQIVVDDSEGRIVVLVDDSPVIRGDFLARLPSGGLSSLAVGLAHGARETIELRIDDVVLSTAPIGCG